MSQDPAPDEYAGEVYRWWHLSRPSPELVRAAERKWLSNSGRALDVGCGLGTDLAYLADHGFDAVGVDLSAVALRRAAQLHPAVCFLRADVTRLPFADARFDLMLDRGCFHYVEPSNRQAYVEEAMRVLAPYGHLFLRSCLFSAGLRNDVDEATLRESFAAWCWVSVTTEELLSDTRTMPALVVLLQRPG